MAYTESKMYFLTHQPSWPGRLKNLNLIKLKFIHIGYDFSIKNAAV